MEERYLLKATLSRQTQADSFEIDIKRHECFSDLLLTETERLVRIVNRVQFLQLQETMPRRPFITVLDSQTVLKLCLFKQPHRIGSSEPFSE